MSATALARGHNRSNHLDRWIRDDEAKLVVVNVSPESLRRSMGASTLCDEWGHTDYGTQLSAPLGVVHRVHLAEAMVLGVFLFILLQIL